MLAGGGIAVVVAQALYALEGVGKTQLALEYAHQSARTSLSPPGHGMLGTSAWQLQR